MQRVRGGGNATRLIALLPCLVGAWRAPRRRPAAVGVGLVPADRDDAALQRPDLLAGRRPRTINMSTIGDDLLRQGGELRADGTPFGPKIEALVVYNSNPVAVAPESAQGRARLRARGPLHRRARALPDRHRRPRRLRAAGDDAARAPRTSTPATATPTCCSTSRRSRRSARRKPNTQIFRELAARMGFDEPCFRDDDEALARIAFRRRRRRRRLRRAARARLGQARRSPRRRSPTAAFRPPSGKLHASTRPASAFPTTSPTTNRRRARPSSRGASRSR